MIVLTNINFVTVLRIIILKMSKSKINAVIRKPYFSITNSKIQYKK